MKREPDRRVALEGLQHRQVGAIEGLGNDPPEVADRLVVVERQGEGNSTRHASPRGLAVALEVYLRRDWNGSGPRDRGIPLNPIDVAVVVLLGSVNRFAKPVCRNLAR